MHLLIPQSTVSYGGEIILNMSAFPFRSAPSHVYYTLCPPSRNGRLDNTENQASFGPRLCQAHSYLRTTPPEVVLSRCVALLTPSQSFQSQLKFLWCLYLRFTSFFPPPIQLSSQIKVVPLLVCCFHPGLSDGVLLLLNLLSTF